MTTLLSEALLEEFAARLRAQRVPAWDAAQPGLSDSEMEQLVQPIGLTLPLEARLWWGWRNGIPRAAHTREHEIGPLRDWLALEDAVAECARIRQMSQDTFADGPQRPEQTWSTTWLPFVNAEGLYVIETNVGEREPSPVHVHWFYEPTLEPDLPSVGELITLWNDAIDQGAWRYDHNQHRWVTDDKVLTSSPAAKRGLI